MKLLFLMCLLHYSSIQTAQTVIFSQSETEGRNISLYCGNKGKVIWSKGTDGGTSTILSAENGEITQKHRPDPENRYSVLNSDLSLVIKSVALSDSGIYYCNATPVVNLTVNPAPPADKRSSTSPLDVSCSSPVSSSESGSEKADRMNETQTTSPLSVSPTKLTPASTVINSEASTTNSTAQSSSGSDEPPKASRKKTKSTQTEQEWNKSSETH
ncbi:uncharacterized protein LOC118802846 [Colossoma macropomum]|uniref:uncharacterized protein LOC118802846 n=1 Tax=Colossoma macropomum TaxID=42526 RepID=UPI0018648519|nr:uncharacterized protein LOC118802846 [Colossoma macropomum]